MSLQDKNNEIQNEFMRNLQIVVEGEEEEVEVAWRKLQEMEQDLNYVSMSHLRTILNVKPIKNVKEVHQLLLWFSRFPMTATACNPISDDIALFMKQSIDSLKKEPCLPKIIEVIKENHTIYLPKTSNHIKLCKAIVEVLAYMPPDCDYRDLVKIKECLNDIYKNEKSDKTENIFTTLYEMLLETEWEHEKPSSALIIVFQLVDNQKWEQNMKGVVENILKSAKEDKIIKMLCCFCMWFLDTSCARNIKYLSWWLTLFIKNLEKFDYEIQFKQKAKRIPLAVAFQVYPILSKFEKISCIDVEDNIFHTLMTKINLHSSMSEERKSLDSYNSSISLKSSTSQKHSSELTEIPIGYDLNPCNFQKSHISEEMEGSYLNTSIGRSGKDTSKCNLLQFNNTSYREVTDKSEEMEVSYPSTSTGRGRRDTSKCGLINLGNTCYMNSVLQALAVTKQFCCEVLLYKTTNDLSDQTILKNLQNLFVLLKYSQKASLSPTEILQALRPTYFMPGQQHDSSEFLCHLLDVLYEQEKSALMQISSTESNVSNKSKVKDEDMDTEEACKGSDSRVHDEGRRAGNMTRWITEENLSEGASLQRKTQSLADFTQG